MYRFVGKSMLVQAAEHEKTLRYFSVRLRSSQEACVTGIECLQGYEKDEVKELPEPRSGRALRPPWDSGLYP
jgi:hypothetical protein